MFGLIPVVLLLAGCGLAAKPSIGVPVAGGDWEITVNSVRQESTLRSMFLDTYDAESGYTFVLVKATVHNRASSSTTSLPEGDALVSGVHLYSEKPAPPTALSLKDVMLINEKGATSTLVGLDVGDSGEFLLAPNLTDFKVASPEAQATYTFAFVVESGTTQQMKFQCKDVPPIPFTLSK